MSETINDQYIIIKKIGEGGMGSVYLAEDILLQRHVAIKSVNKPLTTSTNESKGRFQQEALALARLNHPNITHVYTFVQHQQAFWMVMEYVEGETLEDWIIRHGAISTPLAFSIVIQVLNGLEHAHQKGIIHRDLKPANIMISSEGEVKIMDFGIARIRNSQRLTQHGKSVGTLEYMAPEQIQGKEGDELTDVYAAGNILYEMLSGVTPFKNDTDYHLMKAKLEEKVSLHPSLLNRTNSMQQQIILRSLERNPSKRYPDVKAFKNALLLSAGAGLLNGPALFDALQHNHPDVKENGRAGSLKKFSFQKPVQLLSSLPAARERLSGLRNWWNGGSMDRSMKLMVGVAVICAGLLTWNYMRQPGVTTQDAPPEPKADYTVNLTGDSLSQPPGKPGLIEQQLMENRGVYNEGSNQQSDETKEKPAPPTENIRSTKNGERKEKSKEDKKNGKPESPSGDDRTTPVENSSIPQEKVKDQEPVSRGPVEIPRGTDIRLILQDALSSEERDKDGSLVRLSCAEDVKVKGQVIIPQGAVATGKIVDVVPSSKRRAGLIGFVIVKVKARDGSEIRLSSERFRLKASKDNEAAIFVSGKTFTATIHKSSVVQ